MAYKPEFGLFLQDKEGPLWRGFYADLDEAKRTAQKLANEEGFEFFIFSLKDFTEVARAFPVQLQRGASAPSVQGGRSR
jgi:hypothetical protein